MSIDHQKPSLMVFADASLYVQNGGITGWAGWARGDTQDARYYSGAGPQCGCSTEAELWALANTLKAMRDDQMFGMMDTHIMLQSDSLIALRIINGSGLSTFPAKARFKGQKVGGPLPARARMRKPLKIIEDALYPMSLIYLRHVKGHQRGDTAPSFVNEECDRLAKAAARAQLKNVES